MVPDFELFELDDGARLAVTVPLGGEREEDLKAKCVELFLTGAQAAEIDLSKVESIASPCIGVIVTLWIDLCAAGRKLKLLPSPAVSKVLDMAGLTGVLLGGCGDEDGSPES